MSTTFCHQCGKQLKADAKFCGGCGASQAIQVTHVAQPLQTTAQATPPPVATPAVEPLQPPIQTTTPPFTQEPMAHTSPSPSKNKGKFWVLGLASALILTAGIAVVAVLPSLQKEDSDLDITTPTLELSQDSSLDQSQSQLPEGEIPQEDQPEPEPEPEPERVFTLDSGGTSKKQIIPHSANASSVLPDWGSYTYVANCVLDNNENTAWVEDADGLGIGEWVEVHFPQSEEVWEVQIYNGYGDSYYDNGIMSQCAITLSGGERYVFDLGDRWNTLTLPAPVNSTSVRITILNAHTTHWEDTCISEVRVFGKGEDTQAKVLTETQLMEQIGGLGDVSGLTPAMASAYAQAIYQEQIEHNQANALLNKGYSLNEGMDGGFRATLVDGGNAAPALLIERSAEYYFERLCEVQQLYTWNGSSAVRYTTGYEHDAGGSFYFTRLTQQEGNYHLLIEKSMFGFTGAADLSSAVGHVYYPLEKGQVIETIDNSYLSVVFQYYSDTGNYAESYAYQEFLNYVVGDPILEKVPNYAQDVANSLSSITDLAESGFTQYFWIDGQYKGFTCGFADTFSSSMGFTNDEVRNWEKKYALSWYDFDTQSVENSSSIKVITPSQNASDLAKLLELYGT